MEKYKIVVTVAWCIVVGAVFTLALSFIPF